MRSIVLSAVLLLLMAGSGFGQTTPVVTDIGDQTIAEGATFTTISLDDFVSDLDNTDAEMTWTYAGNTELT
ncbi:MAG: hypothetical protein J7J98_10165, partial [candidate division Zixibacteria bacterium]|nr:hypothetical protein [candidate division Zixibacteria bacterium]